ncbi:MAG: hypothetical protein NWE89_06250 [Candidatus Bathyarchaeota archaeon]|nr:hypothetical protein [Candidatus Bathyarchaeota archaeon]
MSQSSLSPEERSALYRHLMDKYSRLTAKILLGYNPDGIDRLTIMLGKGSDYDYKLLNDPRFRESELKRYIAELNKTNS